MSDEQDIVERCKAWRGVNPLIDGLVAEIEKVRAEMRDLKVEMFFTDAYHVTDGGKFHGWYDSGARTSVMKFWMIRPATTNANNLAGRYSQARVATGSRPSSKSR